MYNYYLMIESHCIFFFFFTLKLDHFDVTVLLIFDHFIHASSLLLFPNCFALFSYYQFNPVSERLEKIDDDVLNMMTKHYQERTNQQDEPFCLLDIGCNTGVQVQT